MVEKEAKEIEKFFLMIFSLLCLETENEEANRYISLISHCEEKDKKPLAEFLENKVFPFLDERPEATMGEKKLSSEDSGRKGSTNLHLSNHSNSREEELSGLLDAVKLRDSQIDGLKTEMDDKEMEILRQQERLEMFQAESRAKDQEISRLALTISKLEESVSFY